MALRKIHTEVREDGVTAIVYYDAEWAEYVTKLYDAGGYLVKNADSFTNDKDDAIGTAKLMVEMATRKGRDHG